MNDYWKSMVISTCVFIWTVAVVNGRKYEYNDAGQVNRNLETYRGAKDVSRSGTGCKCRTFYDCGCCLDLNIPLLGLKDTGCVNLAYLPDEENIALTLTLGNFVQLSATVSARNPLRRLGMGADLCLEFYDVDFSKQGFSGCVGLEARLFDVFGAKVKIGCIKTPLLDDFPISFPKLHGTYCLKVL